MPYANLKDRGLKMFYCINPLEKIEYTSYEGLCADPKCAPLQPTKPTVVLIHGGGMCVSSSHRQFFDERLRDAFNLVGVDLRFHGRTQGADITSCQGSTLGEDVVALLDHLGLQSYALFGEAVYGCLAAGWTAVLRPHKVTCLMLTSPGHADEQSAETRNNLVALVEWATANKGGKGDKSGRLPDECMKELSFYFLGTEPRYQDRRDEYIAASHLRHGENSPEYEFKHIITCCGLGRDIPDDLLAKLTCPVLLLQGEADKMVSPIEATRQWQNLFTGVPGGADLRVIVGGPHMLSFSEASILNRMLLSFVSRSVEQYSEGHWRSERSHTAFGFRREDINCGHNSSRSIAV